MVDRRVREHALHVGLHDGEHRADDQRDRGDGEHDGLPVELVLLEAQVEDPQQAGEAGHLHARGHPRHARAGRALVHVRRPEVERHGRHLEAEADQQQGHARQQQAAVAEHRPGQVRGDVDQVRRAGGAVDERDAVEEEGRRERAEHEVLHARLLRRDLAQVHGGEHVHGEREDLEAEEHHDQVVGRRHHQAARRGQEHEHVRLAALHLLAPQPAVMSRAPSTTPGADDEGREHREPVDAHGLGQRGERTPVGVLHAVPQREGGADGGRGRSSEVIAA